MAVNVNVPVAPRGAARPAGTTVVRRAPGSSPAVVDASHCGCDLGDVCESVARSGSTVTLAEWRAMQAGAEGA